MAASQDRPLTDEVFHVTRARPSGRVAVSVVSPCFNEEKGVAALHRRLAAACREAAGANFEIILVDDGSRDATWREITALAERHDHLVGVHLARNHGHQLAVTAGLSLSRGERVLIIDADLQDPPELLGPMMRKMDEGADVVYGRRVSRAKESWFKRVSAALFYRLLRRLTEVEIPLDTGDFRLVTRRVVDALQAMPERHRFIRGMVSWVGFVQVPLDYHRAERFAGETKYPLSKMLRFALDAITSFSIAPLRVASHVGMVTAGLAVLLLGYSIIRYFAGAAVTGWTSLIATVLLLGSIQLFVLGIMGEYLGRLLMESKRRPLFLIDAVAMRRRRLDLPVHFAHLQRPEQRELWAALATPVAPPPAVNETSLREPELG
jgi:glycosyltransferase involved in cell wall biosynthesis